MVMMTRSFRIVRGVLSRIPSDDRKRVVRFVESLKCERAWQSVGLGATVNQSAGGLYPFFYMDGRVGAFIRFSLPVCRRFSDHALTGIVAHEFAHALRASALTGDWHARMQRQYNAEERHADAIAIQ